MRQLSFDFLVIGGGSGGIASARRASGLYGKKVGLIECSEKLGGTCVNAGCVPKKVMWYAGDMAHRMQFLNSYGFATNKSESSLSEMPATMFDWKALKEHRDEYIKRLNKIYANNLEKEKIECIYGTASFQSKNQVLVRQHDGESVIITAPYILIATGSKTVFPKKWPNWQLGIGSDGFFELSKQPKRVAIVGAGYIAVETAGIFHCLGSKVDLFIRGKTFLRHFDSMISENLTNIYERMGITIHKHFEQFRSIEKAKERVRLVFDDQEISVDCLLWAIGREANTDRLELESLGMQTNKNGYIVTDDYQQTNIEGIYAVGDVTDSRFELTPVAIAAGRRMVDRLFGGQPEAKLVYENIPSAIFSHPQAGSIGLSEAEAIEKYGKEQIKTYTSKFTSMFYSLSPHKMVTIYKLICAGQNEKVVGLHILGDDSAEILQGFSVAIKLGATKADFDNCVAIHPTSAEELVTMR